MNNNKYIGIFDSGFGGLSILKHCIQIMPNENFIYYGDFANSPFGTKTLDELKSISFNIVNNLSQYDLKEIIIACGTISTNVYDYLSKKFQNIHFIGTYPNFEHILKPNLIFSENSLFFNTQTGLKIKKHNLKILIIATSATCNSLFLKQKIKIYKDLFDIYVEPADEIVKFVENNETSSFAIKNYLDELLKEYKDIDYLVLGCTHFPFAMESIRLTLGEKPVIIDSSKVTSKEAFNYIEKNNLSNSLDNKGSIKIIDTGLNDNRKTIYEKLLNTNNIIWS